MENIKDTEIGTLVESYTKVIIKIGDVEEAFNKISTDFPSLVNEENKEEVVSLIKEIIG